MAELLAADGWVRPGSPAAYLRETLPDDYYVIAEPRIANQRMAAAVVGRTGLFAVEAEDEAAVTDERRNAPYSPTNGSGAEERTVHALRSFLRDEFPGLMPPVCVVSVVRDWSDQLITWRVMQPREWADQPLAETMMAADAQDFRFEGEQARAELAVGLRDRQLTASQPASHPFVFRTGRAMRVGARVTTVREAVAHMDRYPADGMHHLRDGTLAAWLEEEGAHHLAALARDVVHRPRTDMRIALEEFLVGTGLVARPGLLFRPETVDLGFVAQGQKVSQLLTLRKKRGRGYLFGEVTTADHWLRVDPREFQGSPVRIVVTAETSGLPIEADGCASEVLIRSSAGEEPIAIPVTVRVRPLPGGFVRWLLRPALAAIGALLIGAIIGALWSAAGVGGQQLAFPIWPVLIAALWALAALIRGMRQPPAWPAGYALGRWSAKALGWSAALALLGVLLVLAWRAGLGGGLDLPGITLIGAAAIGAAFGVVPATLDELAYSRHAVDGEHTQGKASRRRQVILGAGIVAVLLIGLLAPRFVAPAVDELRSGAGFAPARAWVVERWRELDVTMDRLMDDLTMRYYNQPGGAAEPEAPRLRLPGWLGGG